MRGERCGSRSVRFVLVGVVVAALVGIGGSALAQIPALPGPSVPELPSPPPQVMNAIYTAEGAAYPYMYEAASRASVVANAGGFALRPACAEASFGAVVLALAGPSLPIPVLGLASPVFVFCCGAFDPGPADPYLAQVDAAVGPTLQAKWHSAVVTARQKILTNAPQAGTYFEQACGVMSFAPPSSEFPPPTDRFGLGDVVCGF